MRQRTRIFTEDLIAGLERADEVLESHDNNKGQVWKQQTWEEHVRRAVIHLTNALANSEEGTEIEASHGTIRALMALTKICKSDVVIHRLCSEHAPSDCKPFVRGIHLKSQGVEQAHGLTVSKVESYRATQRRSLP